MPPLDPLLVTHGPALARVARVYARTPADAEDLLQDILIAAWRALPGFREESKPRTWLLRIAHNRGMSWAQRRRHFEPEVEVREEPRVSEQLDEARRRRALEDAVRSLPDGQRQVAALALEGLVHAEIAEVLGITENNVAVRLNRARAALKQRLGGAHGG